MHIEYVVAYSVECSRDDPATGAVDVSDDDGGGGGGDGESEEKFRMVNNAARRDGDSNRYRTDDNDNDDDDVANTNAMFMFDIIWWPAIMAYGPWNSTTCSIMADT